MNIYVKWGKTYRNKELKRIKIIYYDYDYDEFLDSFQRTKPELRFISKEGPR